MRKTYDIDATTKGTREDYIEGKDMPWCAEDYDYTNQRDAVKEARRILEFYDDVVGVRVVKLVKDEDGDVWDCKDVFASFFLGGDVMKDDLWIT